jgi:hypothetical protein
MISLSHLCSTVSSTALLPILHCLGMSLVSMLLQSMCDWQGSSCVVHRVAISSRKDYIQFDADAVQALP